MTIISKPDELSLSGNIERFRISTQEQISFVLKIGLEIIISQIYDPGTDGIVTIDVHDIVESHLSFTFSDSSDIFQQDNLAKTFTAIINAEEVTFRVIRSGVECFSDIANNFLTQNFLTWQPQVKEVTYSSPEYLTYYATQDSILIIKVYFSNRIGDQIKFSYANFNAGTAYTVPLQYAVIAKELFGGRLPGAYDVYVESPEGLRLTYIQRYIASGMKSEEEQWVLFENSLGGIDTFRAFGDTNFTAEHTHNIAEIDDISIEYRIDTDRKFKKNTGYLNKKERLWILDFFPSKKKYVFVNNLLRSIVVIESDVNYDAKELPSNYTFTYKYANAKPLLNLPRTDSFPSELNIKIPDLGSFSIPPRLVEFPRIPVSEGVLFPAQNPYSENWGTTTAAALLEFVKTRLGSDYQGGGGIGHTHNNLDLLEIITFVDKYLKVNNEKIKAGYADEAGISRLLETAEFVNSMSAGKGASIDKDGNAQVESIEVRSYMKVMELIFNRLSAMEGDFSFTESGTIDTLQETADNTFILVMRKRWDMDFTAFEVNDIIYGVVNNLTTTGEYYTSWMRVISKNLSSNTLTVVLYPDSETPAKKNFAPVLGMNVTRRGNPLNQSRQDAWYLSSYEGCIMFLQGVTKPILEENNYSFFVGKPKHLELFNGLPINYGQPYVFARGAIIQDLLRVDYQGKPVQEVVDRGLWSLETTISENPYLCTSTLVHDVWNNSCRYRCLVDKTTQEPKWNSTGWVMVSGDTRLTMQLESKGGYYFLADDVDTVLHWDAFRGINLINSDIRDSDIEWTRETGDITSDTAWNAAHANIGNDLHITNSDVGTQFDANGSCTFTCKVFVRDGDQVIHEFKESISI